ncbi:MAG: hypothetical protein ACAI25_07990 [Planctomycetota bacterium]
MSYPYRVVVTKAVEESVDANDRVVTKVTLTPILPKEAMKEVLKGVLEKKGWKERKDGKLEKKGPDGEEQVFDLDEMTLTTEVSEKETIRKEKTVEVMGDAWHKEDIEAEKDRLRAKAAADLEKRLAVSDDERTQKKQELEKKIADKISKGDDSRKKELNESLLEVYAEALKKKAASLGSVTSVKEERKNNEYELTIKIAE